ncbi:MAG: hypothetical protein ACOYOR_01365 [Flavobacterium psychrophilum]
MKPFTLDENAKLPSGFVVPENYFAQFEQKDFHTTKPKVLRLRAAKTKWTIAAAAVLLLCTTFTVYTFYPKPATETDSQSVENYILHDADISSYELAEYLNETELNNLRLSTNASN